MLPNPVIRPLLFTLLLFFLQKNGSAQLKADFTADKNDGCSPLAAQFTNMTTGASAAAIYSWNFSNGNTSALLNPAAIFRDETTYVVTLTVTDNNKTSSASHTITVYQKPIIDFSVSVQKGCVPLSAVFTAHAKTFNGGIPGYYWDFGDGITQPGADSAAAHLYTNAARPSVSLTVTDNHGCQGTLLKEQVINVLPELVASFSAEKTVLCKITDPAVFLNNSAGTGTLNYLWDFGDGNTSVARQPSHVFDAAGIYSIKLSVNSSEGCTAASTQNNLINAATFKSEVDIPGPVCNDNTTRFNNNSKPSPAKSLWEFSDGYTSNTTGSDSVIYYFNTPGNYSVKLTNTFGTCKDVFIKPFIVKKSPVLNGFVVDLATPCGSPATVNFKDTTAVAVSWQWSADYTNLQSNEQAPSYTFMYDNSYYVGLKVTDSAGCTSAVSKQVDIYKPNVVISSPEDYYGNGVISCGPKNIHFIVTASVPLKTYAWDFGDGSSSTEVAPAHLYRKAGNFYVHLAYTTVSGCDGKADFYYPVAIRDTVKANFAVADPDICGNNFVTFTNLTPFDDYYAYLWDFGDNQTGTTSWNQGYTSIAHQYQDKGTFTIRLIATNGICSDTIVRTDYVKISPPFPKISSFTNTCDGTRGEVTFNQASTQVISGTWNFGDGSTAPYVDQPQIKHTYNKTGFYKVVLTTSNGRCTVADSTFITVLLKQHPVLSGDKTVLCSRDDFLQLTYSSLEVNPSPYGTGGYGFGGWYHSDDTYAIGHVSAGDLSQIPFVMSVWDFTPGTGLYSMVTSSTFGCVDTTNLIPLTIKGPVAGFKQDKPDPCGGSNTVILEDTSKSRFGVALVLWEWNFGDGQKQTYNQGGKITHTYNYPGNYPVYLTVTDADGCHDYFQNFADAITNSLQASFDPSLTTISPGSSVTFTNTSQSSDADNTTYKWLFGDGSEALTTDAVKTFSVPGKYLVQLVAYNNLKGCRDTAFTTITVKYVNAAFAVNSSYIGGSKCPPVVVSFTNTSSNVSSIYWDFGDGSIAANVFNPSHVYTKAGKYIVQVTTYSDNGTKYVTKDSVVIEQPSVATKVNLLHSCTAQSITFTAIAKNVSSYLWDFGDGSIIKVTDAVAIHNYPAAGIYIPHIIITDSNGCSTSVNAADTIIIDSLNVSLPGIPAKICAPKEIVFNPAIISISGNQAPGSLTFHWDFGTGNARDTSREKNASFLYQQPGNYPVRLQVNSAYGCVQVVTKTITASQGLTPYITGPPEICQNTSATFKGNTQIPGQPQWLWIFENGTTAHQQNPPAKAYNNPGSFPVILVVDNNGCTDTVTSLLKVYPKPVPAIFPHDAVLCEGSHLTLTASGGGTYKWFPATALSSTVSAAVEASPLLNTIYVVTVTDPHGCTGRDSVALVVIHPFTMQAETAPVLCAGKSTTLHVSGADTYKWINYTTGLSNVSVANPVATPLATATYTVTGTDAQKCFTDTASIVIKVSAAPVADAGKSAVILPGTPYQLQPITSPDVVKWNWSPAQYLSCNNCASPVARPSAPVLYTLTVTNAAGCTASDTVSIQLFCSESRIFIPTAFTPNGDNLNEVFTIIGEGIQMVNFFRIYDRWGTLVFERNRFQPGDISGSWNGRYKGALVPQGTYTYSVEMSCKEHTFVQKGNVSVLY